MIKDALYSSGGAQFITPEFELQTAAGETQFACGARDVAAVFTQGFSNHSPFEFFDRGGERQPLGGNNGGA